MKKRQGRAAKKVSSPPDGKESAPQNANSPRFPLSLPSLIAKGKGIIVILVDRSLVAKEVKDILAELVKKKEEIRVPIDHHLEQIDKAYRRRLPIIAARTQSDLLELSEMDFDQFWRRYPNKAHKQHSFKTFLAVRAAGITNKQIADALIEKIKAGAPMPPAYRFLRAIKK